MYIYIYTHTYIPISIYDTYNMYRTLLSPPHPTVPTATLPFSLSFCSRLIRPQTNLRSGVGTIRATQVRAYADRS